MRVDLLAVSLASAVFVLDLSTSSDFTPGTLYTGVVLLTLWSRRPGAPWIAAAACTALLAVAAVVSSPAGGWSLVHRGLDVVAVWSIAFVAAFRHRAENRVAESSEKMRLAVEGALLGVFDWHIQSGVFEGNARLSELLGLGDRPLDRPIEDFFVRIHPDDRDLVTGWFSRMLEDAVAADTEYRFLLPADGGVRWLSSHCRAYRDRDGKVERICGALHDVTPRRLADEAQREAEKRLRLALAAADFGVFDWDLRSRTVRTDDRFSAIYGLAPSASPRDEASVVERIHPADADQIGEMIRDIRGGGGPNQAEYRVLRRDGETRWISANARADLGPDGKTERIVGVVQDVTESKAASAASAEIVDRERCARHEAEASRAAAEAANRTKDEFLAVVSHELRAPLSPMLGWTELLREGELDEEDAREALDTIERNIRSLARLVSDLLDVSRILAGKLPISTRPTTLEEPVAEAIDSLAEEAERRGIVVSVRSEADRRLVSGDPDRLRQIAWNLVSNAIKFTPAGGRVDVEIVDVGNWIDLRVRDTGKGIEPDAAPLLFERFWQEDGSLTRSSGGLGLGLSIVKHLAERHRGTVSVESAGTGKGATFTVRLPALKGRRKTLARRDATAPDQRVRERLVGLRVLAVDDDAATAAATSAVLTHHGAEVKTASSASEALTLLERWKPGVLVSDLAMPGTDGFALISELRRREHDSGTRTPAIALSALARAEDRERALAAGFDGYITKPVDAETLAAEIAHAASRQDPPRYAAVPSPDSRASY
jgi:PAS domain S-box-containing protein